VKWEIDAHKDVFEDPNSDWFRDPQEAEILAAIQQDEKEAERLDLLTSWNVQPTWVRLVMIAGAVSASLSLYMQGGQPFEPFDFRNTTGLAQLPEGRVVNMIRPAGYGIMGFAFVTLLFLVIFKLWSSIEGSKQLDTTDGLASKEHQISEQTSDETLPPEASV